MAVEAPVLLVHWETFVGALLDETARFPKAARFTFARRIEELALDILELLVEARYLPRQDKGEPLAAAQRRLHRLHALLRLSHERRLVAPAAFERLVRQADEGGRMLGGWVREVQARA
jgi:hypothetical protein